MKKSQDKIMCPGEKICRSKSVAEASENLVAKTNIVHNTSPGPSSRGTYSLVLNNTPIQHRKSESRDFDKADPPRRKNRRRERKHDSTKQIVNTSTNLAPPSSSDLNNSNSSVPNHATAPLVTKRLSMDKPSLSKSKKVFTCVIRPIMRPQDGTAFRIRSKTHKYVNLKSFLGLAKTCVFKTEFGQLSTALKHLTIGSKSLKKHRKYFERINEEFHSNQHNSSSSFEKTHSEMLLSRTERDKSGREVTESVLIVEDTTLKEVHPKKVRFRKKNKELKRKKQTREAREIFPCYVNEESIKIGLKSGEFVKGTIRINPKSSRDAYVNNDDSTQLDYFVASIADRNRALEGDQVVLKFKPEAEWQDGQKTGVVIYISDYVHPRTAVGNLKRMDINFALFTPRDKRMPSMLIPSLSWPEGFKNNSKAFTDILFIAKLVDWPEPYEAIGMIIDTLGLAGDLKVETQSILKEFCLDVTPFSPEMVRYLPKSKGIPAKELEYREDIRKECIFTIDPLTARDLDDAVSVKELPNGHYEVGVHISDASFYLQEGTDLDKMVSSKATTIYLVDSVYHMLPVELCLHCSLLPGDDKLAFSVFWEMNERGEVFNTRFARTILNSCAQLAYEHAQQMIEDPDRVFKEDELPPILNGFTAKDLSKTVNVLQKIATSLREGRIRNGSLRIDQVKLLFSLNPHNGEPLDYIVYENKESHRLIEEFMLMANISVAKKIKETFSDIAFLRCHEPPKHTMLLEAQKNLETCGIHIDVSSSGGIHSSLRKYITDDYQGFCRGIVLNHIFAKPMTRARYFCAGTMETEETLAHYALSVPIYTHFTSPIRRYADIMVHRLLAASLGYAEKPNWDVDHVVAIAANCNKQKYNAKRAGEASSDLYLAHYIEKNQPYVQNCVVVDVKDRSFDAIVLKTGSLVRVYQKRCEDNPTWTIQSIPLSAKDTTENSDISQRNGKKVLRLIIDFPSTEEHPGSHQMLVEMFSVVKVELKQVPNSYKLDAYLLRPIVTRTYESSNTVTDC